MPVWRGLSASAVRLWRRGGSSITGGANPQSMSICIAGSGYAWAALSWQALRLCKCPRDFRRGIEVLPCGNATAVSAPPAVLGRPQGSPALVPPLFLAGGAHAAADDCRHAPRGAAWDGCARGGRKMAKCSDTGASVTSRLSAAKSRVRGWPGTRPDSSAWRRPRRTGCASAPRLNRKAAAVGIRTSISMAALQRGALQAEAFLLLPRAARAGRASPRATAKRTTASASGGSVSGRSPTVAKGSRQPERGRRRQFGPSARRVSAMNRARLFRVAAGSSRIAAANCGAFGGRQSSAGSRPVRTPGRCSPPVPRHGRPSSLSQAAGSIMASHPPPQGRPGELGGSGLRQEWPRGGVPVGV